MCVAVITDPNKEPPTLEQLQKMERANRDGGGVGWSDGKKCFWKKGLKAEEIHAVNQDLWTSGGYGTRFPTLIHFRIATVGGVKPELTHPFVISQMPTDKLEGGMKLPIIIHNGHWSDWSSVRRALKRRHPTPDDVPWSDTKFAARALALGYIEPEDIEGRVARLNPDGTGHFWGDWHDKLPFLCSNTHWDHQWTGGHVSKGSSLYEHTGYYEGRSYDPDEWEHRTGYNYRARGSKDSGPVSIVTPLNKDVPDNKVVPLFTEEELAGKNPDGFKSSSNSAAGAVATSDDVAELCDEDAESIIEFIKDFGCGHTPNNNECCINCYLELKELAGKGDEHDIWTKFNYTGVPPASRDAVLPNEVVK